MGLGGVPATTPATAAARASGRLVSVSSRVIVRPSLRTVTRTRCPGITPPNLRAPASVRMDTPSICVSTSPGRKPARAAGLPGATIESSGADFDSHTGLTPGRSLDDHPQSVHRIEKPNQPRGDAKPNGPSTRPTPATAPGRRGTVPRASARGAGARGVVGCATLAGAGVHTPGGSGGNEATGGVAGTSQVIEYPVATSGATFPSTRRSFQSMASAASRALEVRPSRLIVRLTRWPG